MGRYSTSTYLDLDGNRINLLRIRVKNDLWVLRPGKAACQLKQFHLNLGEAMLLQGVKITKSNVYGLVNLALARDPLSCELWYIVSDEKT
jgi:hypothetical protein